MRTPTSAVLALLVLPCAPALVLAQNQPTSGIVIATVRSEAGTQLAEAEVRSGTELVTTDADGLARLTLPAGRQRISVTRIGFQPAAIQVQVPRNDEIRVTVTLDLVAVQLDSVTVLSTRIGTNPENSPLKVDVVAQEDISEKSQSSPGSAVNIFREPNALLQVQTTAPSLGGVAVRIQGLRGRYTQVLADGLPIYGTESGDLSLVQIPPLDLGRVEIIRGAASALYGGQALGGVINLFSREPIHRHELLAAQAYRDATDLVGFAAGPLSSDSRWAYTLLAGGHRQQRRDLDGDGWTDLPGYRRLALRPRLFWSDRTGSSLLLTAGTTLENREAGTVDGGVTPTGDPFPEVIDTRHFDLGVNGQRVLSPGWTLSLRGAAVHQFQEHLIGERTERDRVRSGFAEVALVRTDASPTWRSASWVLGAAIDAEGLRAFDVPRFDRTTATPGAFVQYDRSFTPWLRSSTSLRLDHSNLVGTILSPRVSILAKMGRQWSARLSGGTGFAAPTARLEETAVTGLQPVAALGDLVAERARSASLTLTGRFGGFEVDGTLFGSAIDHALQMANIPPSADSSAPTLRVVNAPTPTRTWGTELFARWTHDPFLLTATYTYTDATEADPDAAPGLRRTVSLTPQHVVTFDGIIEEEETGQVALEVSYVGQQALEDDPYGTVSHPYVIVGFLAMKRLGQRTNVFLNAENLTNVRLSDYQPLIRPEPGPGGRWTVDAWAPLEGSMLNLGVRLVLP
ncbi:MAG: TonB-dependent receptor domain-containing protein [Gemmatimonadales bacterium]